jgi:hypothetical protein
MHFARVTIACLLTMAAAAPAYAQRFVFERRFDVTSPITLDVHTIRGQIEVADEGSRQVIIRGAATVRVGWPMPANAEALAREAAAEPPISRDGDTIRLAASTSATSQQAVTISYQVLVPSGTTVTATSESGAVSIQHVGNAVTVRTQSGAVELRQVVGRTEVTTGSGAVSLQDAAGTVNVKTMSSAVTARGPMDAVRVETESGTVEIEMALAGDVDVHTGSSAIDIRSARGGLRAVSRSGHVMLSGAPGAPWTVETGSGAIDVVIDQDARIAMDASTGSGSVGVDGFALQSAADKRHVQGSVNGGGPLVQLKTRSGTIHLRASRPDNQGLQIR